MMFLHAEQTSEVFQTSEVLVETSEVLVDDDQEDTPSHTVMAMTRRSLRRGLQFEAKKGAL